MEISNSFNKKSIFYFIIIIVLVLLSFNAGYLFGEKGVNYVGNGSFRLVNKDAPAPQNIDFDLFWDTWNMVKEKYPDKSKIDEQKMFYGAISGMVASLDDPYTVFFNPEEMKKFNEDLEGVFEGIGAEIGVKKDIITIIAPLPDSPAEKAGLQAGDKIYKINDAVTIDMTLNEAVNRIRGPKGTTVVLTILRDKETDTREIKITRNTIVVKSVKLEFKDSEKGKIAILKISRFGDDTYSDVQNAAKEILNQGAKAIVLDLRNNPGGLLESAVNIAGVFMTKGEIVTIERKSDIDKKDYITSGRNELGELPLIILANEGSASAAEILAGALRDNRQIKIVGEKTFGKGSVQELHKINPSESNASLKITIAEWLTPSGKNINKEGLNPDIEIKLTSQDIEENKDPQMDVALKELQNF